MKTESFVLYVDESGGPGLNRRDPNRHLVLGALLCRSSRVEKVREDLVKLFPGRRKLFPGLGGRHISDVRRHSRKAGMYRHFAGVLNKFSDDILLISVISFKDTLRIGYDKESNGYRKYYNKCLQYLLEYSVDAAQSKLADESSDVSIHAFIEKSKALDEDMLRNYIDVCLKNPKRPHTKNLRCISDLHAIGKSADVLLKGADMVSHAVFQAVTPPNDLPEFRYLREILPYFYGYDRKGKVAAVCDKGGIYCIHHVKSVNPHKDFLSWYSRRKSSL